MKYIDYIPQPLLDDLVAGKWLPVIGAGMSKNAIISTGGEMPLWDELGKELAKEIQDYPYNGALDALSAYSHEFGRPRLVERLSKSLHIDSARPSSAHEAFCSIPFEIVCTTNFDFLLERQYNHTPRYCRPIIDEDHLAVNSNDSSTALLKLHGDVHHPKRLIVTEEDYDGFLNKYPLLATYLANLLITRTAVLIGYSLDDPDFRQIWQVIGERLGKTRRLAYALIVDARATEIARFARRGVKVISLPGLRTNYNQILTEAFTELQQYLQSKILSVSQVIEEEPLQELSLPPNTNNRLCFFAIPLSLQAFYRDRIFPVVTKNGFVPITAIDVISPGDNYVAKIDALIARSALIVVDVSTAQTTIELRIALAKKQGNNILIVTEKQYSLQLMDSEKLSIAIRPVIPVPDDSEFFDIVSTWFGKQAVILAPFFIEEPLRLLNSKEYRAAVISAISLLETSLREQSENYSPVGNRKFGSLMQLLLEVRNQMFTEEQYLQIRSWLQIRNALSHSQKANITRNKAQEIVNGVMQLLPVIRRY